MGRLVSIVLPVLNGAKWLEDCLISIRRQTHSNWELLVFDDGSTDRTVYLLEAYARLDGRIRVYRRCRSYIRNLNEAFELANGDYIARMDADDIMLPYRLQAQVAEMERRQEIDLLGSTAYIAGVDDRTGEKFHTLWIPPVTGRRLGADDMLFMNHLIHPSVMFRRSTVRDHDLRYRDGYMYAEDLELWIQCLERGLHLEVAERPLVVYRKHADSMSEAGQARIRELRTELDKRLFNLLEGHGRRK